MLYEKLNDQTAPAIGWLYLVQYLLILGADHSFEPRAVLHASYSEEKARFPETGLIGIETLLGLEVSDYDTA